MSMKKWQHLKIPFDEIKVATNNFEDCIGKGGYGCVYKGQLSVSGVSTTVAVKRLNETLGQGLKEFLTEIDLLSERGSLDKYLKRSNSTRLTWLERLKICVDAARGLDHLHNRAGEHQTIIHRDIKSANILLDENWVAKISDLGLSKLSFSGLDRSVVISHACGTPGYCEPEYIYSGVVKKESDVYSFGMVLFEAICGRLCSVKDDDGFLLSGRLAKQYYESKKLDEIIDPSLKEQMNAYSKSRFSAIAYGCLHDDREQRPGMDVVMKELEETLKIQEEYEFEKEYGFEYWETKLPRDVDEIIKLFEIPPKVSNNKKELFFFLCNGIYFDTPTKELRPDNAMAEKYHQKRKQQKLDEVKAHLAFEEASQQSKSRTPHQKKDLRKKIEAKRPRSASSQVEFPKGKGSREKECTQEIGKMECSIDLEAETKRGVSLHTRNAPEISPTVMKKEGKTSITRAFAPVTPGGMIAVGRPLDTRTTQKPEVIGGGG
ncbi:serine-threonine/tyrosine-protein kinase catalytic domain-containing protein [Artemisia annua]|uniref:Serine-threonine/tyrosine-protein kinase catalytic domain-containing protein n=1 Tax=Artemisia annua TaxID=35608 RepID=A0A2U1NHR4_ARTAN|nr:serine-threonine/tyrosine-protein kinase catalytic domain-containing protein [Artemisia annua]